MAFCSNCGSKLPEETSFCSGCGHPVGQVAAEAAELIDFTIQGDNLQVARVRLKPGQ